MSEQSEFGSDSGQGADESGQPGSDVSANPQDTTFGAEAAEDLERVDRGEQPAHDGEPEPHAAGKADSA
ncbi:MAG: hypothetical protein QOI20_1442 [Acidimicrobiaceae bacterium]|jgi:hypothetical protein|nr:hypothetical protein [Acidimicrobiaceae bacterium]